MLRRTLVLALLAVPATAAHATAPMNPGGWGQLAGSAPAMVGAAGAALTPDGSQLLVAGGTDAFTFYGHGEGFGGLTVFGRDAATGALTRVQCVSSDGSDGDGNEACDPATAFNGANSVAVSPDGVAVAVAATGAGSITLLARDAESGRLAEVACVQQSVPLNGRCRQGPTLDGVSALTFTPDGRDVLAVTPPHNALVDLHRDDDGVTHIQCFSATGTSGGCTRVPQLNGADALAVSSDGRQVYLRTGAGLVWLARDLATGALTPGGCVNPVREGGSCQAAAPADPYAYGFVYGSYASGGHSIVLSPDGASLYTGLDDGLSAFRRDDDGTLHVAGCYVAAPIASDDTSGDETVDDESVDDTVDEEDTSEARTAQAGTCTPIDAFEAPRTLAITPDGSTLFSSNYSAVSILHRDSAGVLTDAGCLAEEDDRCGAAPVLGAPADLVAADGQVYGVGGTAVATFGPAPALTPAGDGSATVSCAVACSGTTRAVTYGSGLRAGVVARGAARAFDLHAGGRVRLRLRAPHRRGRIVLVARPRARRLATGTLAFGRRGHPAGGRYCLHSGCRFLGGTVSAPQARAGRFAAFAVRSRARRGATHTAIAVVDLTHRRVTFLSSALGSGHGIAVPRIVVKRDGAIAWIACRGHDTRCTRQHADEVHVHDALGTRLLSSAPGHVSTYLSLTATTLTYEIAGVRRRVPLR
jgi:DNA-binding beta-propeller fold protein YncE